MTNPTPEQIEAEARERFPELDHKYASLTYPAEAMRAHNRSAFESGARWAGLVAAAGVAPRAEYHRGYQEGLLQAGMAMQASIDAGELVAAAGVAPCSELLCPLHHDGDSSPRNRADERTDSNLVDESPDRQACNKSGNDGHDHFRSVHNAQGSNGADSPTPGVTPQDNGDRHTKLRQTISDLGLELADATEGWRAALEVMENHKCHDQAERAYARAVAAEEALAAPVQVDEAKLAEVVYAAIEEWADSYPTPQVSGMVAKVVAAWLRGGGQ